MTMKFIRCVSVQGGGGVALDFRSGSRSWSRENGGMDHGLVFGFQQWLDHHSIGAYGRLFPKRRRTIRSQQSEHWPQLLGWQGVNLVEKDDFPTIS